MLKQHMEGFLGVSYDGTSIENGMERLKIICEPYTKKHIQEMNQTMMEKSQEREASF